MPKISRRGFIKSAMAMTAAPLLANTHESEDKNSLKFIHITDSHMDLEDQDSVEAMELMVTFINAEYKDLDFVLFGGDNFNNNAPGNTDALRFKKIIDGLHCPSYLVRGNKESSPKPQDDSQNLDDFKTMFFDANKIHVHGKDWLLSTKGYNILGLDSCVEHANNGVYTDETLAFAQKVLEKGAPTIVLNHHPYTNYWKGTEAKDIHKYVLNNTDAVQKRLFTYSNLILTLSGHKHIDSVTKINGTKAIVTRGFIRPLDLDMYPMRYVEINGSKIDEKLIYTA
ncbi:metallophosphoesterase [Sulfurimonas sp. MAG313]|nr:metallophosphoesterase [Sulfurimonas sp. MAG313]MDF1881984.1 metallophosphoesterase [Sulfurimonas sp. MAG313]